MPRWAWVIVAVAVTGGCQSLPYEGAADDAKFLFGGKWEQKEEGGATASQEGRSSP